MRETTLPNEGSQCRRVLLHRGRHRLESLRALSTRLDLGKPVQYLLLHTAESSFFCRFVAHQLCVDAGELRRCGQRRPNLRRPSNITWELAHQSMDGFMELRSDRFKT